MSFLPPIPNSRPPVAPVEQTRASPRAAEERRRREERERRRRERPREDGEGDDETHPHVDVSA